MNHRHRNQKSHSLGFTTPSVLLKTFCICLVVLIIAIYAIPAINGMNESDRTNPSESQAFQSSPNETDAPRIAALLPFAADQLIQLGIPPIAVPTIRGNTPVSWDEIPDVSINHSAGPNIEQLIALDPDYIITSSVYAQFIPAMEKEVGAQVISMDVDSIPSVTQHIQTLGEITNRSSQAKSLINKIDSTLNQVSSASLDQPQTLAIFGTPHSFYAFLPDSYLGDLIELSGGSLTTSDMKSHPVFKGLAPVSMEAIIHRNPELLMVVFHGPEESARAMLERDPLWSKIQAVEDGRVAFLQDDLYAMRPGSEFTRALNEIQQIIQSDPSNSP